MRRLYLVYFILGTIGIFSLTVSHAYADFEVQETYAGTGTFGSQTSESSLEWTISSNSGSEKGTTDTILALPQLSFNLGDDSLTDVKAISVIGIMDQSDIGINYCYTTPNWNFVDIVKVNGVPYTQFQMGKILQQDTEGNPIFKGQGLEFDPSVVERLLELQGVTLRDGDIIQWEVTVDNRFDLWQYSSFTVDTSRTPESNAGFSKNADGQGSCIVSTQPTLVGVDIVDRPVYHQIFYTTGMKMSFDMTWVDIAVQTLDLNPTANDLDGDGIPDHLDLCTFEAENFNGYQDDDGCADSIPLTPEQIETVSEELDDDEIVVINDDGQLEIIPNTDNDNDGFPNDIDFCPNQAENFNGIQDFDGCPDGVLTSNSNFVDNQGNPIVFDDQTTFPIISSPDPEVFDFIADNTDTFNPTVIVLETSTGVETESGISDECNPVFENCNEVIAEAIRTVEEATGIKLPFEPSILNFVILFGIVGIIIFMIGKATKKI